MTALSVKEKIHILQKVAELVGGKFRDDYSGRGMFGKTCCGISCRSESEVLDEVADRGIYGAKVDSLGRGVIVYWPSIAKEPTP